MATLSGIIKTTIHNNTKTKFTFRVFDKTDGAMIVANGVAEIKAGKNATIDVPRNSKSEYILTAANFYLGQKGSASFNAVNATAAAIRFNSASTGKRRPWPFHNSFELVYWFDVGVG